MPYTLRSALRAIGPHGRRALAVALSLFLALALTLGALALYRFQPALLGFAPYLLVLLLIRFLAR